MSALSLKKLSPPEIDVAVIERERRISSINDQFNRDVVSSYGELRLRIASLRARRDEELVAAWRDYFNVVDSSCD